jgi:hypothetical protein
LVVKAADYQLIAGNLYKLGAYGILRRCVLENERPIILEEEHDVISGGHYAGRKQLKIFYTQGFGGLRFTKM